jgi:hypothetical protein
MLALYNFIPLYCPSCGTVKELAAIPAWFGGGLPPPPDVDLH